MTEALPTSLSVVLDRRPQFRLLVEAPRSRGDLVSACAVSGSTVDRALDDLESAGCVEPCDEGYRATRAGGLLHERFEAVLEAGFDADEFELVARRRGLLETLRDRPLHKAALTEALPISRATVNRAIADLEAASLVERATEGYVPTDRGRRALDAVRSCLDDARRIDRGREILAALPDDDPLPDEVLLGGEYVPLDDPDDLVDELAATLRVADRYRLSLPEPPGEGLAELWRSLSVDRLVNGEVLLPEDAVETLRGRSPRIAAGLAAAEAFSAHAGEPPAFGLLVATPTPESAGGAAQDPSGDGSVASAVIVAYDAGEPVGVVECDGVDAAAWATETLDERRAAAEQVSPADLDPSDPETSFDDERLPRTLRTQGFVSVDDEYFERREPLAPAMAWRSGIGLPEVEAGYAAERRRDDGTPVVDELIAGLADGVDTAVLGPAASGKSTVCKRVAVAWHRAERGPVLYRTSSAGSAFDDVGALEAALRTADGHALVVVEDAVRPEANAVFEAARSFEGVDDVTFLLDARRREWHDPEHHRLDARLAAYRREHVSTASVPRLDAHDCERIVERVEEITDRTVATSGEELLSELRTRGSKFGRDEPIDAERSMARRGSIYLLMHRLVRYVDPLVEGRDAAGPSSLEEQVDRLRADLADIGETALDVGVLANLLTASGVEVHPGYLFAVAPEERDRATVRDALDRLEGEVLFRGPDDATYESLHETWSVTFLARYVEDAREAAVRERVGRVLTRLLALADDAERRSSVAAAAGLEGFGGRIADPASWVETVVEQVTTVGAEFRQLAPLFAPRGDRVALPEVTPDDLVHERQYWLGRSLSRANRKEAARRAFEALPDDDRFGAKRRQGLAECPDDRSTDDLLASIDEGLDLADDPLVECRLHLLAGKNERSRGEYENACDRFEAGLACAEEANLERMTGAAKKNLGDTLYKLDDPERGERLLRSGLEIGQRVGDRSLQADCLEDLASAIIMFEPERDFDPEPYYRRALDLKETVGDEYGVIDSLLGLAAVAAERGDLDTTVAVQREVLAKAEALDVGVYRAGALVNLVRTHWERGDIDRAADRLDRAIRAIDVLGEPPQRSRALRSVAMVAIRLGQYHRARALATESQRIEERPGMGRRLARSLLRRGTAEMYLLELDEAERHLERAVESTDSEYDHYATAAGLRLAVVRVLAGEIEAARVAVERTVDSDDLEALDPEFEGLARGVLGAADLAEGQVDEAALRKEEALDALSSADHHREAAVVLALYAGTANRHGNGDLGRALAEECRSWMDDSDRERTDVRRWLQSVEDRYRRQAANRQQN